MKCLILKIYQVLFIVNVKKRGKKHIISNYIHNHGMAFCKYTGQNEMCLKCNCCFFRNISVKLKRKIINESST